ncbi:MAG: matrixin family metalloprotease [Myxococcales bacterium]|nr:matrixin family metalloprotease [Myxococcales bacterium]
MSPSTLRVVAFALVLAGFSLGAPGARAWQPLDASRPVWCKPTPYAFQTGGSPDLGAATSESETRRAFEDWAAVECTDLTLDWKGKTSTRAGLFDNQSVVGWVEQGWPHDPNAIGVTTPAWSQNRCISEADMLLNGVNYLWSTNPGAGQRVNAYSILLHEAGHYIGLGHSQSQSATMFFAYTGGVDSLQPDDRQGVCALYPEGGAAQDCSTVGCPAGQACVSGECQTIVGDGTLCAPCGDDSDCGGPDDFCLNYPDGAGYCGQRCSSQADCPGEKDFCVQIGASLTQCARVDDFNRPDCASSNQGNCMNDTDCGEGKLCATDTGACINQGTGGGDLGADCTESEDCNTNLCLASPDGSQCTLTCDWLNPASCPTGFYCNATVTGTCGTGLCLPGSAGTGVLGSVCDRDTDCESLYCIDGECGVACIPNTATGCPEGRACQPAKVAGCGSCDAPKELGEACGSVDECLSRLCAQAGGGRTFCTQVCEDAADCPAGFSCDPAGDTSVCVPPVAGSGTGSDRESGCSVSVIRRTRMPRTALLLGFAFAALSVVLLRRRRRAKRG